MGRITRALPGNHSVLEAFFVSKKSISPHVDLVKAVTDFPAALFAPELIATYPEAKVILTERDIDKWHR